MAIQISGTTVVDNSRNLTNIASIDLSGPYKETVVDVASGTDINCNLGNYFIKTVSSGITFTFSNAPASRCFSFTLEVTLTSGSVGWPSTVKWPADVSPTLSTGKTHLFVFVTDDGGTRWRGSFLANYTN